MKLAVRISLTLSAFLLGIASGTGADVADVVLQAEQQRIAAVRRATRSAVAVFSADGNGGGSGVVISPDGFALTFRFGRVNNPHEVPALTSA